MSITTFAKILVETGRNASGLTRQSYESELSKRAAQLYPNETAPRACSLAIGGVNGVAADAEALLLLRASKIAPPAVAAAAPAPRVYAPGVAEAELNKKVDEYLSKNAGKSREQAFAAVYTDRANLDLKKRYDDEQARLPAVEKNARAARRAA